MTVAFINFLLILCDWKFASFTFWGTFILQIFFRLFINKLHFFMQLFYHFLTAIFFLSPVNLIWRELEVGCEKITMTKSKSSRPYPKIYHFRLLLFQSLKIRV